MQNLGVVNHDAAYPIVNRFRVLSDRKAGEPLGTGGSKKSNVPSSKAFKKVSSFIPVSSTQLSANHDLPGRGL
jgi:hypothetical protein